jgi:hypothetical protein
MLRFCQVPNINGVHDVRQTGIHTCESLYFTLELLKLRLLFKSWKYINCKIHKLQDTGQILALLIHTGGEMLGYEGSNFGSFIWNKQGLPEEWKEFLLYLFMERVIGQPVLIIESCNCYEIHAKFYQHSSTKIISICRNIIVHEQYKFKRNRPSCDRTLSIRKVHKMYE